MVRIPSEYQEVEWIGSTSGGGQYIELPIGFYPTDEVEIYGALNLIGTDKFLVAPKTWNDNHNRYALFGIASGNWTTGFGDYTTGSAVLRPLTAGDLLFHKFAYKNYIYYSEDLDISTYDLSRIGFNSETVEIRLFFGYNSVTPGKIAYYKHKKANGTEINLVSCYRKSDNEPGMYDTVTGTFYTNSGTGTFTVGNDVSYSTANLTETRRKIILNSPHIESASGNICTFSTDMTAKLKSCRVNFLPKQAGSGDPSPDNVRVISGTDHVTVTRCGKNLFSGERGVLCPLHLKVGTVITVSVTGTGSGVRYYDKDQVQIDYWTLTTLPGLAENRRGKTFTIINRDCEYVEIYGGYPKEIQIELGSTPTAYEPYTVSIFPVTFSAAGKNLFDKNNYNYITAYPSSGNLISANATRIVYIPCKPNTTYTASTVGEIGRHTILTMASVPTPGGTYLDGATSGTITTGSDAKYIGVYCYNSNVDTNTFEDVINALQIEIGSTATAYEPYTTTLYGGYVDLVSGELVAEWVKKEVNGAEPVSSFSERTNTSRMYVRPNPYVKPTMETSIHLYAENMPVFVPDYQYRNDVEGVSEYKNATVGGLWIAIDNNKLSELTRDGLKAYLAANPITVCYQLETPTLITTLTPQQLKTLKGVNNVYSDADNINVTYYLH